MNAVGTYRNCLAFVKRAAQDVRDFTKRKGRYLNLRAFHLLDGDGAEEMKSLRTVREDESTSLFTTRSYCFRQGRAENAKVCGCWHGRLAVTIATSRGPPTCCLAHVLPMHALLHSQRARLIHF